jgi:hypothetical protein
MPDHHPSHSPSIETIRASILESRLDLSQLQYDLHDTVLRTRKVIFQSLELIAEADKALARR